MPFKNFATLDPKYDIALEDSLFKQADLLASDTLLQNKQQNLPFCPQIEALFSQMPVLNIAVHPDVKVLLSEPNLMLTRHATRAIVRDGDDILLMHTKRYQDYSLPGGGLDQGEDPVQGMMRELSEETGAQNIRDVQAVGIYEEYRPWYKADAKIMQMYSYCYRCCVDKDLGDTSLEHYEVHNGMQAKWVNIHEAIAYNKQTIATSEKKGMSIERETYLLELIAAGKI